MLIDANSGQIILYSPFSKNCEESQKDANPLVSRVCVFYEL